MIQKIKVEDLDSQLGDKHARVETGPLQINNDWPGTFIRGDNSFGYALELEEILGALTDEQKRTHWIAVGGLQNLLDVLKSSTIK